MSQHPNVELKALEEVDRVLDSDINSPPTEKQIQQLKYIPQILKEALRLYPPAPAFGKVVENDGTRLGPYRVDKGTVLFNSVFALHRHPKYWKNPDTFDPENFSPENMVGRHPCSYLPFSTGPRACIGMQFALLEATVSVHCLAKKNPLTNMTDIRCNGASTKAYSLVAVFKSQVELRDYYSATQGTCYAFAHT